MKVEIFKTDIKNEQQANYLLTLLRKSISDALIDFDFKENHTLLKVKINRDVSEIVHSLFITQGVDCQKL
ncbi:hypothetical protein [Leeuwenhoekiella marinoflava]|uniref:Uncharacterized protein n=2 Tax=Leeuwenhoekiella marinoflava TaxID=988 RepID=A0A4Q0PPQ8_9FLAO|nr:hypothetical protein [Leeuwenhoekiella marinoflava]RXG32444.1 hypothetical protein DSL99_767 [Leeuwenhoekiella marinoflava]SHE71556.1 hypothetical protein SAMN02745246_00908 [Leeuwenhoekiella marinoflava DSM 3653]